MPLPGSPINFTWNNYPTGWDTRSVNKVELTVNVDPAIVATRFSVVLFPDFQKRERLVPLPPKPPWIPGDTDIPPWTETKKTWMEAKKTWMWEGEYVADAREATALLSHRVVEELIAAVLGSFSVFRVLGPPRWGSTQSVSFPIRVEADHEPPRIVMEWKPRQTRQDSIFVWYRGDESKLPEEPDEPFWATDKVYGFRTWSVRRLASFNHTLLRGAYQGTGWPQRTLVAKCDLPDSHPHMPGWFCNCGIYATKKIVGGGASDIVSLNSMKGVIEHELGYRARESTIEALYVYESLLVGRLSHYQIPYVTHDWNSFLAHVGEFVDLRGVH